MDIIRNAGRLVLRHPSALVLGLAAVAVAACNSHADTLSAPVPTVPVIRAVRTSVPVTEDYAAQTEAVDTLEIRARVGGILERQAFEDGSRVQQGKLLFVIDRQPYVTALALAKAGMAQAQASLINSRQNLERVRPLAADHAISQQDLDAAVAKERADAASVDVAEAQVRQAQLNLGYSTITAPRDGVVSKALIKPGGLVNPATTLLTTLYSVDPIYVNFAVSERRLAALQTQLQRPSGDGKEKPISFRLKLADGSDYKFDGQLNYVDAAVDPKSGTLQMRLSVPNPGGLLRPGQFVRVILAGQPNPNAILVPQKAVQEIQGMRSVFVVDADGKASYREIVANTRSGNDWVVEGGLAPGELVIVDGVQKLRPGAAVKADLTAGSASPRPLAMETSAGNGS